MKTLMTIFLCVIGISIKGLTFKDMNTSAALEIGESFLSSVQTNTLCVMQPFLEDMFFESWLNLPCAETEFHELRKNSYYPVHLLWCCKGLHGKESAWIKDSAVTAKSSHDTEVDYLDVKRGFYRPFIAMDGRPILTFLSLEEGVGQCEVVKGLIITNLAFYVNGLTSGVNQRKQPTLTRNKNRLIEMRRQLSREMEEMNPLIELSEREATEIVYLTALCRSWVRTMDEFNAAFVPNGETFLVRLTVPECETEIGRMLYDLARKRGLLGQKGKGAWK